MDKKDETLELIVYLEDDNTTKTKEAFLMRDSVGVNIQIFDRRTNKKVGEPFFLPWHRVLKTKQINNGQNE